MVIAGTLLWSMLYGLERMAARKEETRPTQEEEPKGDTEAAARFQEVMDYVDAYFVLDYDKQEMINEALKGWKNSQGDE